METTKKLRLSLDDLRVESFETAPEAETATGTVLGLSDACTDCSNCSGCSNCSACSNCTGCSMCSGCTQCSYETQGATCGGGTGACTWTSPGDCFFTDLS